jgi:hypothetical protein
MTTRHSPTPVGHGPVLATDRRASPPLRPSPSSTWTPVPDLPPSTVQLKGAARRCRPPFLSPSCAPSQARHEHPPPLAPYLLSMAVAGAPPEPCHGARSHRLEPSLTFPVVHWCCRSAYPLSVTLRVPPLPRTSPSSRLRRTSPSTHRSGEPPLPPPCQACYRRPHDARTSSPATPHLPVSPGRPCHCGHAARADRVTSAPGARAPSHRGPIPNWPAGRNRGPQCGLALCAQVFQFSFSFIILEI